MLKYPNKKSDYVKESSTSFSHRGMNLEDDINSTNRYYLDSGIANIHKKPTPITLVKVDYKSRSTARITEAYFQIPSTTDYNGVYRGKYIDFEAKETNSKTAMPLSIIHHHQLDHLEDILRHGGIAFLIIRFNSYDETYVVDFRAFSNHINSLSAKSVKYSWFKENAAVVPYNYVVRVDYLKVIDKWIDGGN